MQEPDDFGFSPLRTLARVADPTPAAMHSPFWTAWWTAVSAHRPELRPRREPDPSDPTCDLEFESLHETRIGCRLILPPGGGPVRAGIVTTHGYEESGPLAERDRAWRAFAERGAAVLLVRIRGYPGSRLDCGDLTSREDGLGWIARGLDAAPTGEGSHPDRPSDVLHWTLPRGVGDLANACRAMADWLTNHASQGEGTGVGGGVGGGAGSPQIFLHGESFGAGLAAIAAAQLAAHAGPAITRLAIAVPTFGDWPWRLAQRYGGAGGEIAELIRRRPDLEYVISERLRLLDAVVHARRISCDALGKLAERDDVVPAPSAAAVFNALHTDPGRRWRFVTPYGHFDGGLAHQRREALFARCLEDFFDPAMSPEEAMGPWEPVMNAGERMPDEVRARREARRNAAEASRPPAEAEREARDGAEEPEPMLFGGGVLLETPDEGDDADGRDATLIRLYERAGRTLDDLPYTPEFEALFRSAREMDAGATERSVFHRLHNLRKAGRLPRLGRSGGQPPAISGEEEETLRGLVVERVGKLGQRDRLPYTREFDEIIAAFNARTGRSLHPHDVWRLVAKLAK